MLLIGVVGGVEWWYKDPSNEYLPDQKGYELAVEAFKKGEGAVEGVVVVDQNHAIGRA